MYYVIQENTFREENYNVVTRNLYRNGYWINRSVIFDNGALNFCKK